MKDTASIKLDRVTCQRWIAALRGGEYKQCRLELRFPLLRPKKFCCLGVLQDVRGVKQYEYPNDVLPRPLSTVLATMNDRGTPFSEIADYVEAEILPKTLESTP